MYSPDHNAMPLNPLPPVIAGLAGAIALIELALQAAARGLIGGPEGVGWRLDLATRFGFSDRVFDRMVETGAWQLDGIASLFTYSFVHANFTHALFAIVILLALGNAAARVFPPLSLLAVFLLSGAVGAAILGLFTDPRPVLIGAYPAIYGLLGLYTWLLWVAADEMGQNRLAAFRLVGLLVALQIAFGLIGGGIGPDLLAEVAGFIAGFLMATPALPGGFTRLRQRIRGY